VGHRCHRDDVKSGAAPNVLRDPISTVELLHGGATLELFFFEVGALPNTPLLTFLEAVVVFEHLRFSTTALTIR
jgi:hypothetical protein